MRTYGDRYPEDVVALRSFLDVNLPKFTSDDLPLFKVAQMLSLGHMSNGHFL